MTVELKKITSLKALRKFYSLSQEQMAFFIGTSVRNYREKEKLKLPFNQIEMMKIILLFDLTPEMAFRIFYTESYDGEFWRKNIGVIKRREELLKLLEKRKTNDL